MPYTVKMGKPENSAKGVKGLFTHLITLIWWHLPIKREGRKRIKDFVFTRFRPLFCHTKMYRNWKEADMLSGITYNENDVEYPAHWPPVGHGKIGQPSPMAVDTSPIDALAIILHVYHVEIMHEILRYLAKPSNQKVKLFVTCPYEKTEEINGVLSNSQIVHELLAYENRGRDVLPFLKACAVAFTQGYGLILKLHTKKSDHRMAGSIWRKEIFNALLPAKARNDIVEIFNGNPSVGILGPAGHIVPMSLYYGANAKGIGYLCRRLGVDTRELHGMAFVAGSMFYARKEAILPLLELGMPDAVFEPEAGQLDGTMAHAYERGFAISSYAAGLWIVDNRFDPRNPQPAITANHRFTW